MNFKSNHSYLTYFWALGLAIVLGVSPVQNATASISSSNMKAEMKHNMNSSSHHMQVNNSQSSNSEDDYCKKAQCKSTHCAGTIEAFISSDTFSDYTYIVNSVYKSPHLLLTHHYASSLFRPPKF